MFFVFCFFSLGRGAALSDARAVRLSVNGRLQRGWRACSSEAAARLIMSPASSCSEAALTLALVRWLLPPPANTHA